MTMSRNLLPFVSPSGITGGLRALLFALLLFIPAIAGAQGFTAELGGDAVTRYNWRGLDFGDGASVQPYLRCEFHGFKGGLWGSYSEDFEEIDTWVSYSLTKANSFSVGATAGSVDNPSAYGSDGFAVINIGVKGIRKINATRPISRFRPRRSSTPARRLPTSFLDWVSDLSRSGFFVSP